MRWWQGVLTVALVAFGAWLVLSARHETGWDQAWRVEVGAAFGLLGPLYVLEELLRSRIEALSKDLRESVQSYGVIWRLLPAGDERTTVLDALVEGVRDRARRGTFPAAEISHLTAGDADMRAVALAAMQGDHDLIDEAAVVRSIDASETGFEQFHALRLAYEAWRRLSADAQRRIVKAIDRDAATRKYIAADPHRAELAQRIKALSR